MKKNIVLCGFMGCGKSTVGRLLADKTDMIFVDMDQYIEEKAGKPVSRIFAEDGEEAFRAMEREACRTLGRDGGLVIATGGGAVLNADNVTSLAENGTIVWLTVTADTVIARLADDTTRPLLQRDDKEAAIAELLAARAPLYRRAAAVIVDAARDPRDVVESILAAPSFS